MLRRVSNWPIAFISVVLFSVSSFAGCSGQDTSVVGADVGEKKAGARTEDAGAKPPAQVKRVQVGPSVILEVDGDVRRVLVTAKVCRREGELEEFMTRSRTKEHEAVLVADVDGRNIHAALIAAGAEPGQPTKFQPKFQPPRGTTIKVDVQYMKDGKEVRISANKLIRTIKGKKPLDGDWVFAGSFFINDPIDKAKPPFYAANDGDLICISNFEAALLDVPFSSSNQRDDLLFEAATENIPAVESPVTVILTPVPAKKK